jgi:DNA-binding NarL/FixJ family response regulator
VRIIIVDDHEIVREGLLSTLAADETLELIGAVGTGAAAIGLAMQTVPDIALVDLRLPDMSGEQLCRELLRIVPSMSVVILSTYLSEDVVRSTLEAGAAAYVTKAVGVGRLREVLRDIQAGIRPAEQHAQQIVKQLGDLVAQRSGDLRATPQQQRVLQLAARGLTNREIGEQMLISESTVRFHMEKLREKMSARTRTEVIVKAIRSGMVAWVPEDATTSL